MIPAPSEAIEKSEKQAVTPSTPTISTTIIFHIEGAIRRPGVYQARAPLRLFEAVRQSGGLLPDARIDAVNLAETVIDGEKIAIPFRSEPANASEDNAPAKSAVVRINSATLETLLTLPGIGPRLAQNIITARTQRGGFRSVDDLKTVEGLGAKKLARLKPLIFI